MKLSEEMKNKSKKLYQSGVCVYCCDSKILNKYISKVEQLEKQNKELIEAVGFYRQWLCIECHQRETGKCYKDCKTYNKYKY